LSIAPLDAVATVLPAYRYRQKNPRLGNIFAAASISSAAAWIPSVVSVITQLRGESESGSTAAGHDRSPVRLG